MRAAHHTHSIFHARDSHSYLSDSSQAANKQLQTHDGNCNNNSFLLFIWYMRSSMLLPFLVGVIIPMKCE